MSWNVLTKRERNALSMAQHFHRHMGWIIASCRAYPKPVLESLVKKDLLAPMHTMVELCDDDGFKAYTKRGRERFVKGESYQLTVSGLEWESQDGN